MRNPCFPFHALGFRSNPFRALTNEEWAAIVVLPDSIQYLAISQDTFKSLLAGLKVFLLDEAQRLRPDARRRLLAAARGGLRLILGSHEDLTALFNGAGLCLSTVRLGASSPTHLASILERRLAYFALPNCEPGVTLDPGRVHYLEAIFGTNRRAMEHFLYEVFQRLDEPVVLTADRLKTLHVTTPPFQS